MKKRVISLLLALLALCGTGLMEAPDANGPNMEALMDAKVTGEFDKPALIAPETRYEHYVEQTDGSEELLYMLLDAQNDEAADIEQYGALYITEHPVLNSKGEGITAVEMSLQNSPYGPMICAMTQVLWMKNYVYEVGNGGGYFIYDGETVEHTEGDDQETFDFYMQSYHFPYGRLETLNGIRQDENGYAYLLIRSDEDISFEFVTGEGTRILQLRMYQRNKDGALTLKSYTDYDVGPAWEIPQAVLDAMEEALGSN